MLKTIKDNLKIAQHRMIQLANKKRIENIFKVEDWVYLKLQPYKQQMVSRRGSHKLAAKYYGNWVHKGSSIQTKPSQFKRHAPSVSCIPIEATCRA